MGGIVFTSIETHDFICGKCFAREIGKDPRTIEKIPANVKKAISPYLYLETDTQPSIDEPIKPTTIISKISEDKSNRNTGITVGETTIVEVCGVMYFKNFKKLEEVVQRIKAYYGRKAELLPLQAPRKIGMKIYCGENSNRRIWALTLSAEIPANGQEAPALFREFIKELAKMEPVEIGLAEPEKVKRMRFIYYYCVGHRRLTEFSKP